MRNPARSVLHALSIPTRMALEESEDLLAACDRLGLTVPRIFLNLLTPPGGCGPCDSLRHREASVAEGFREAFPNHGLTLVYRQPAIAGLDRLERLGRWIYARPGQELACLDAS